MNLPISDGKGVFRIILRIRRINFDLEILQNTTVQSTDDNIRSDDRENYETR